MRISAAILCAFMAIIATFSVVTANVATATKEEAPLLKESSAAVGEQQAIEDKAVLEPKLITIPFKADRRPTFKPVGTRAPYVQHAPGQPQYWFGFLFPPTDPPSN